MNLADDKNKDKHMSLKKLKQHEFIDMYLEYTRATESPKIMHIWSALGSASACLGRHAYLPTGIGNIYPNIFALLVGPPGTRKSQALKYSAELVRKNTQVRFAPDDTGSQRQGLLMALVGDEGDDVQISIDGDMNAAFNAFDATDIDINTKMDKLKSIEVSQTGEDKYCLFAAASEFTTFMGTGDPLFAALLNKVWDGEPYDYRLKSERKTLVDSLMTIIGCTTQSEIARILPAESIGQGFMSRWMLVFAPKRDRRVPIDEAGLDNKLEKPLGDLFSYLYHTLRGEINFSPTANQLQKDMYMEDKITIEDSRFMYYLERRHTHLLKTATILTALRRSSVIEVIDIEMANMLLVLTEAGMPDALGEFGLSPISAAKQKLLEFLRHADEAVTQNVLWSVMSNDMKMSDFTMTLRDLESKHKVVKISIDSGVAWSYIDDLSNVWEELIVQEENDIDNIEAM